MLRRFCLLLVLCLLPTFASAQYRPDELNDAFRARVLDVGEQVRDAFPAAWRNAHTAGEPQGSEYVRRWALALRANGILACVNGKRGGDTLSQDVLTFPLTAGGAQDTSGRYYGRIAIIDVIASAGLPSASLAWIDQSIHAPGKCIEPFLDAGEPGGPPPPTPLPPPGGTPGPQPDPPPTGDMAAQLRALTAAVAGTADRAQADALYGLIAEQVIAVHIANLYERLERLQQTLDAIDAKVAKIANARILRY